MNQIDRCLRGFESTSEWADLIAALSKLNKVFDFQLKFNFRLFVQYGINRGKEEVKVNNNMIIARPSMHSLPQHGEQPTLQSYNLCLKKLYACSYAIIFIYLYYLIYVMLAKQQVIYYTYFFWDDAVVTLICTFGLTTT